MSLPSSPSSPPSPSLLQPHHRAARAPFYKLSSLSELELANLSLADMFSFRQSQIPDDELDSLPALGESVVEEAEERFHARAHQALAFAATPAPSAAGSALPSPTRSSSRLRPPSAYASSEAADPSYFALSRSALYSDGGDSSFSTSSASTPSLWSSHSPSLSDSSAFTGTPADSVACSPLGPRSPANGLVGGLNAGAGKKGNPLPFSLEQLDATLPTAVDFATTPAPPTRKTIAARRGPRAAAASGAGALKLSLPPLRTAASFSTLRLQGGSKSPAAPAALSHLSAPSSPTRGRAHEGQAAAAGKPTWVRELEVAAAVQDGVRLKQKKSTGFAF